MPSGSIDVILINVVLYMNAHMPAAPSYARGLELSNVKSARWKSRARDYG